MVERVGKLELVFVYVMMEELGNVSEYIFPAIDDMVMRVLWKLETDVDNTSLDFRNFLLLSSHYIYTPGLYI